MTPRRVIDDRKRSLTINQGEKKMKKKLVNLTPHSLNIQAINGTITVVPPSGTVARVDSSSRLNSTVNDDIAVYWTTYGDVIGLPKPKRNTVYIVSSLVLGRVNDRDDVFGVGDLIRDDSGKPIACKGLKK